MTHQPFRKNKGGRPRKYPLPAEAPPQGAYKKADVVERPYQVLNHTRDCIKVVGPKGADIAILYRTSKVPGRSDERVDHPLCDWAAAQLADLLNEKSAELRG